MQHAGGDRALGVVRLHRLCDGAMVVHQLGHAGFLVHPQHTQSVDLGLLGEDHVEGELGLGDGAESLVELIVQRTEGVEVPRLHDRFLLDQRRIQLGRLDPVAAFSGAAQHLFLHRGAHEAGFLDLAHREAFHLGGALWTDEQQVKIGKAVERIAHGLTGHAETCGDVRLGNPVSGAQPQAADFVVKVVEYVVDACSPLSHRGRLNHLSSPAYAPAQAFTPNGAPFDVRNRVLAQVPGDAHPNLD